MRLLFTAFGYLSFATVLSAALGVAYLWQSERLDDERVFQIVALIHGIDLDDVNEEQDQIDEQQEPAEEMSLEQSRVLRQIVLRDQEVKQAALLRGRQEFKYWHAEFKDMRDKLDRIALQIEQQLSEQGDELERESVAKVVQHLESVAADTAKKELLIMLKEPDDGIETVIKLLNAMQPDKLKKVLKTFATQEELADLHLIHREMLKGGRQKQLLDNYLEDIDSLDRS